LSRPVQVLLEGGQGEEHIPTNRRAGAVVSSSFVSEGKPMPPSGVFRCSRSPCVATFVRPDDKPEVVGIPGEDHRCGRLCCDRRHDGSPPDARWPGGRPVSAEMPSRAPSGWRAPRPPRRRGRPPDRPAAHPAGRGFRARRAHCFRFASTVFTSSTMVGSGGLSLALSSSSSLQRSARASPVNRGPVYGGSPPQTPPRGRTHAHTLAVAGAGSLASSPPRLLGLVLDPTLRPKGDTLPPSRSPGLSPVGRRGLEPRTLGLKVPCSTR
jgi:hypothetical protein